MSKNDFKSLVLARKPFSIRVMGVVITVEFDEKVSLIAESLGVTDLDKCKSFLNPELPDNALLSAACHEVLENINAAMEWKLKHPTISQLDLMITTLLEIGEK